MRGSVLMQSAGLPGLLSLSHPAALGRVFLSGAGGISPRPLCAAAKLAWIWAATVLAARSIAGSSLPGALAAAVAAGCTIGAGLFAGAGAARL